jgi:Leucine-rich repeat (LRR) protein
MEINPNSIQFYSKIHDLVNYYQKDPEEEKLNHIYSLIKEHFQNVDASLEIDQLNQLRVKFSQIDIDKNNKIMKLINNILSGSKEELQEPQISNWETIPDEIKVLFISYLGDETAKTARVNQELFRLFKTPIVQAGMIERYAERLSFDDLLKLSTRGGRAVKSLDLSQREDVTDAHLASLLKAYPNLQMLKLKDCDISDEGLKSIAQLPNLQILNLKKCNQITDEGLKSIAQLHNLQMLNLNVCLKITNEGLKSIAQLSHLQTLKLHACNISDEGLKSIAQLPNLQTLDLAFCDDITDEGLKSLISLQHLKKINLNHCWRITNAGLKSIAQLHNLQMLNLKSCWQITDEGLKSIAQLQNLKKLHLGVCRKITEEGLKSIAQLPNLQTLELYGCDISDEGLKSIAQPNLQIYI